MLAPLMSSNGPKLPVADDDLDALVRLGAESWPGLEEPARLRTVLAERLAAGAGNLSARAADLYLATACASGAKAAIAILDAQLPELVRPALIRIGVLAADVDEIVQRVRVALLAPDEHGVCGIASYTGRGDLRAYVRAVAVRRALKRIERETPPPNDDQMMLLARMPDANDGADVQLLKQRWADDFRIGFARGTAALSPRERTMLRQHYVDGLSVDMLAPLYQVHRATCARWIEAARNKILHGVREYLRTERGLDATELERALALIRSQLDLSMSRHFAAE